MHVLRVYRYRHSNNGTVMRLPFFRDNQWGPLSRRAAPTPGRRGAPCRLKGQSPSYLRFGQLSLSRSFSRAPTLLLSFAFSLGACARSGPRRAGNAYATGPVENSTEIVYMARFVRLSRSTPTPRFFGRFPRGA